MRRDAERWIGKDQGRYNKLMEIVFRDSGHESAIAAWSADSIAEAHPTLAEPHLDHLVKWLPDIQHHGIRRQMVRMLARMPLPEKNLGLLLDTCLAWMADPEKKVAVKVHCMEIAGRIAKDEPEIIPELKAIIREESPKNTIAFWARARMVLKKLGDEQPLVDNRRPDC